MLQGTHPYMSSMKVIVTAHLSQARSVVRASRKRRIVCPLYGRSDGGDTWWYTTQEILTSSLYFRQSTDDPFLPYGYSTDGPSLLGVYIEDRWLACMAARIPYSDVIGHRIHSKTLEFPAVMLAGSEMKNTVGAYLFYCRSYYLSLAPLTSV